MKISALDIRIAVLAYPLVLREEEQRPASVPRPILPFVKDERIVSLFQNSPKPRIELSRSKMPPVLRKSQFALLRLMEILKAILQEREKSQVLSEVAAPRKLLVPNLPHPRFKTPQPPRFFFSYPKNEHLMSDTQEDWPTVSLNSSRLCSYARNTLQCSGHLKQDADGFAYLELSDNFVAELFRLLDNQELEPCLGHIPVMMPHEWALRKGLGELKELGNAFSFEINNLSAFQPMRWPDVEKVYILRLHCKELERLREKYLLPSRILGHDFHVPIAFKSARLPSREIFRLNVSCFAA